MALRRKKNREREELQFNDEDLQLRMTERRSAVSSAARKRRIRTIVLALLVFALLVTVWGRDILRLKAENVALKKQQVELEKQRDALKEELKTVNDPEYVREQARKQLRLLNPGEILFTFDDGEEPEQPADEETEEDGGADE